MTKPNRGAAGPAIPLLTATCVSIAGIRPAVPSEAGATPPRDDGAEAVFEPPERTIRGVVVDEEGRPVAGATVRPVRKEKAPGPATTDDDGRFTLTVGEFILMEEDLVASADDGARLGLGTQVEPESSRPAAPVRIVLKPSRRVADRVRDEKGQPVAGAAVEAVGFDYHDLVTTDADGAATLRVPRDADVRWITGLKPGVGFNYFENHDSRPTREFGPLRLR